MSVCVPVTWYAINLKLDAFVDMGSRLGSTKHVLVSVVVQMTDNLLLGMLPRVHNHNVVSAIQWRATGEAHIAGLLFRTFLGPKRGPLILAMFSISGAEAPEACFEACLKMLCSNDEALVSLEACFQVCLKGIFLRQQEAVLLQHKFSVETASCVALNRQT